MAANNKSEAVLRTVIGANFEEQSAAIVSEQTARADADSALSSDIETLTATAGDLSAAVQTNATAIANTDGSLAAMYTIKTQVTADGKTYAAGIGVGVDNASGILQSQVLVSADRFAVINQAVGTTTITTPFAVQGGQVYINNAVIQDGSIVNAKIGDVIQSTATNSTTGLPVWLLNKNGTFQLNGTTTGRMTIDAQALKVFDESNVKRVQLGNLNV